MTPTELQALLDLLPTPASEVAQLGGPGQPWSVRYGATRAVLRRNDPGRFRASGQSLGSGAGVDHLAPWRPTRSAARKPRNQPLALEAAVQARDESAKVARMLRSCSAMCLVTSSTIQPTSRVASPCANPITARCSGERSPTVSAKRRPSSRRRSRASRRSGIPI
jgi:hypothetical protein